MGVSATMARKGLGPYDNMTLTQPLNFTTCYVSLRARAPPHEKNYIVDTITSNDDCECQINDLMILYQVLNIKYDYDSRLKF